MTFLLAVLVSGVLLNAMDVPVPEYHLVFVDSNGKLTKVVTDKDGKFQVELITPETYRLHVGLEETSASESPNSVVYGPALTGGHTLDHYGSAAHHASF
jgi:hypothetical protein